MTLSEYRRAMRNELGLSEIEMFTANRFLRWYRRLKVLTRRKLGLLNIEY